MRAHFPISRTHGTAKARRRTRSPWKAQARLRNCIEPFEDRRLLALPTGVFEFNDNNAVDNVAAGVDWQNVFAGTSGALATTFIADPPAGDVSYFTGGGSKDVRDIPQWLHQPGDVAPDKNDITDAYAAAFLQDTDGVPATPRELIVYFGADKFDASGSNQIGFWFFKDEVTLDPDGTFNGVHQIGDTLVLTDFTQGGRIGTVKVYKWVGSGGSDGVLDLVNSAGNTSAVVNDTTTETAPWPYTDKDGNTSFAPDTFFEGGINMSALGLTGCFSSFLAESRSSGSSLNAQLKDFALGSFELCSAPSPVPDLHLSKATDEVTYRIVLNNAGALPLYLEDVSNPVLGSIVVDGVVQAPDASKFVNSIVVPAGAFELSPGETATILVTRVTQATDPDPTVSVTSIVLDSAPNLLGENVNTSATHSVDLFRPGLSFSKTADKTAAKLGDTVTYTYTLTNQSDGNLTTAALDGFAPPLVLSSITDSKLGNLAAAATAAGLDVLEHLSPAGSFTVSHTVGAADFPGPLTNTADVLYNPQNFPNRITGQASASVDLVSAFINIAAPGVNAVGDPHTFTATVTQVVNGTQSAASGANVAISLAGVFGASPAPTGGSGSTNASGQFSVTFTSATAGQVNGTAMANLTVAGVPLTVSTNGTAPNSGPVNKRFVDALIRIDPSATNGITENHTFTITVLENAGTGAGYVPAAGETVKVSLTPSGGASPSPAGPFTGTTNASGQFLVTFTSATAGTVVGHASSNVSVGGISVSRQTDGQATTTGSGASNSGDATKVFIDGSLRWLKRDAAGALLGGATFEVRRTHDRFGTDIPDVVLIVLDNGALDADSTPGEFQLEDLALGTYTIKETIAPPGYALDPDTETVILTLANPSNADGTGGDVVPVFVNVPVARGQVLPTGTTCDQFVDLAIDGTTSFNSLIGDLADGFNLTLSGGKISNVADPGQAFYFTTFTAPVDGDSNPFSIKIRQISQGGSSYLLALTQVQISRVLGSAPGSTCQSAISNAPFSVASDGITFSVPDSLEGVVLVARIRIDPKNIIGQPAPATDLRNDFATFIDPAGGTNFGATPIDEDADGVLLNIPPYAI